MQTVTTMSGSVAGSLERGVHAFKGIPYAAPISGAARWRAPGPVEPWDGVRDATRFGSICPQEPPPDPRLAGRAGRVFIETLWVTEPAGDDCLNLNVWTPSPDPDAKLPVMFWIHGGAFTTGSGSLPIYDGTNLASRGVVVVTVNYRLGMMGSFVAPGAYDDGDFCVPNRGFLDQTAALRWTRENIAGFGGDPDNVTIFGESAGGQSVAVLLASPATTGLFRRAIVQSGTPELGSAIADHELFATDLLEAMDVPVGDRAALTALTADETVRAARPTRRLMMRGSEERYGSIVTGGNLGCTYGDDFLPVSILESLEGGQGSDVDLMIGTVRDDGRLFPLVMPGPEPFAAWLCMRLFKRLMTPKNESKVMFDRYRSLMPDASKAAVRGQMLTDVMFRRGSVRAAERHAGSTYLYRFDWPSPVADGGIGAMHGIDVPFANGNLDAFAPLLGDVEAVRGLADTVAETWVNFARHGVPSAPGLPVWEPFGADSRANMTFDTAIELQHDVDRGRRAIW